MKHGYQMPNTGGATISTRLTVKLMEELHTGAFKGAERLPAEVDLAKRYGVSRSVIRDVLSNLEREGYVERGRGVGTVVNREVVKLASRLDFKFEYNSLIKGAGATPGCDMVKVYELRADEEIAEKLEVDVGSELLVVEKRMLASGRPVIYSIDHLPKAIFKGDEWKTLDWYAPVFDILEQRCGIDVESSITRAKAVCGPKEIHAKLQLAEDEAMLMLDEVGYYKMSRPILHTYGYYSSFFEFSMLRKKF